MAVLAVAIALLLVNMLGVTLAALVDIVLPIHLENIVNARHGVISGVRVARWSGPVLREYLSAIWVIMPI